MRKLRFTTGPFGVTAGVALKRAAMTRLGRSLIIGNGLSGLLTQDECPKWYEASWAEGLVRGLICLVEGSLGHGPSWVLRIV